MPASDAKAEAGNCYRCEGRCDAMLFNLWGVRNMLVARGSNDLSLSNIILHIAPAAAAAAHS